MKYLYKMYGIEGALEEGEVYTLDWLERKVRSWIVNESFTRLEVIKDESESVEDVVVHYLEWLANKMKGDLTEEELDDTDLGWEIGHVDHTIGLVEDMKKRERKIQS